MLLRFARVYAEYLFIYAAVIFVKSAIIPVIYSGFSMCYLYKFTFLLIFYANSC